MSIDIYWRLRASLLLLQSVVGAMVFAYALKKRTRFALRLCLSTLFGCVLLYFVLRFGFLNALTSANSVGRIILPLLTFIFLAAIMRASFAENIYTALFVASAGYAAQDIAGSVKTLLRTIPLVDGLSGSLFGMLAIDLLVYSALFALMYFAFRPFTKDRSETFDNRGKAVFSAAVLILCFGMMRLTGGNAERNATSILAESIYQFLCDLFVLIILFGVMERRRLRKDVDSMRELVHEQHEQFRHSKQSVELVNEKYHDLKSLLEGFHGEISPEQIDKLKARVGEYDTHVDTGNHVLDIVLSEKRAIAAARKIDFTSYADGTGLDYLEELDLYSLVGNALGNAIDAVSKLPEGERFISLTLRTENGMTALHVENPYSGEVEMENDLPKSRRDRRYHGFGMKSMERICEKYGGTLAVTAKEGIFSLDAVLFRP